MTSTIKVDNIQDQCGTAVVTKCGSNKTLAVTTTKADNYQAADGGNIINQCGTAITIGASGDTVSLASGASQSGFGRTGTVNWDTTKKTADFTAVNGEGYFVDTTSSAITVTLPASPSAGNIVAIADYAGTSATNNITINRNSSPFQGGTQNGVLSTNRQTATFVYIDGTQGWVPVNSNDQSFQSAAFVTATGGTVTTCGNFKIHTFTGPGTFCVSCAGNPLGSNTVSYLVVAGGGGGGGANVGAGGGAGGFREGKSSSDCYTASPLNAPAGLPVTAQGYPITVGGGGAGKSGTPGCGTSGANSVFSTITSAGGGGGGGGGNPGVAGGSGGGAGECGSPSGTNVPGAAGNTPPVSPPQGNDGGAIGTTGRVTRGAGGGGAGGVGGTGSANGNGGNGVTTSINASPVTRAGGGGGGRFTCGPQSPIGAGGPGGGGAGSPGAPGSGATDGTDNTGGGGGGSGFSPGGGNTPSASGGSGIVIIRYKYQ